MKRQIQSAAGIVPESFYDLLGIFIPGITFLGTLNLLGFKWGIAPPEDIYSLLEFALAGYITGHLLYSLSTAILPKVASRREDPRRDFVAHAPKGARSARLSEEFTFRPSGAERVNLIMKRVEEKWGLRPEEVPRSGYYELCRNYVAVKSKDRAVFIRKEQAYGELARSSCLASFILLALVPFSPLPYKPQLLAASVGSVSTWIFYARYLQARLVDPVMVYYSFLVLHQEELEPEPVAEAATGRNLKVVHTTERQEENEEKD